MNWRPICEVCEAHPQQADDPLCIRCRAAVEVDTTVVKDPVEIVLSRHLPLPLPGDGQVMCLCHSNEQSALFTGPVYHRRHIAELIYAALGLPGPVPHEPLLTELAKGKDA